MRGQKVQEDSKLRKDCVLFCVKFLNFLNGWFSRFGLVFRYAHEGLCFQAGLMHAESKGAVNQGSQSRPGLAGSGTALQAHIVVEVSVCLLNLPFAFCTLDSQF